MLGLYAFIVAVPHISGIFGPFVVPRTPGLSPLSLALLNASGGALQMLVGIGLWWFSNSIAQSAVPEDGEVPVRHDEGLTAIGFSVVGAYLMVDFAVKLATYWANLYMVKSLGLETSSAGISDFHTGPNHFIPILVQGALGVYLLLGAHGLVRGLANFRNVGRDREIENEA
ncbi:hypothetical protein IAD21_01344 [Abditibacteriota bacterium]|nr:hypothetical protein IAD21_01344 [Abditibacteriota bacterium]